MREALTRHLDADKAKEFHDWLKAAQGSLEPIHLHIERLVQASLADDSVSTFQNANPLAELAHKAGYREGLRHALALLKIRG